MSRKINLARLGGLVTGLAIMCTAVAANASLIGQTINYDIDATVGNTITSNDYPLTGSFTAGAGQDLSQAASLVFTSSGFPQTFGGTVTVDVSSEAITVGWSGTAQGVALSFDFTGLSWGPIAGTITGLTLNAQSCVGGGINCTASGSSFRTPTFTANSVIGMGMNFSGFQPGTSFSQTYDLVVSHGVQIPEPGTLAIFTLGLAGLGLMRRRPRRAA